MTKVWSSLKHQSRYLFCFVIIFEHLDKLPLYHRCGSNNLRWYLYVLFQHCSEYRSDQATLARLLLFVVGTGWFSHHGTERSNEEHMLWPLILLTNYVTKLHCRSPAALVYPFLWESMPSQRWIVTSFPTDLTTRLHRCSYGYSHSDSSMTLSNGK